MRVAANAVPRSFAFSERSSSISFFSRSFTAPFTLARNLSTVSTFWTILWRSA